VAKKRGRLVGGGQSAAATRLVKREQAVI